MDQRCRPMARRVRRAVQSNLLPEPFTMARYKISPYMGCGHGCVYCDGRAERYFVEGDFQRDILYRENLPDLLHKELPRLREFGPICLSSGITDAYQPIEKELFLTRRCAEILRWFRFPVTVLTKSSLIERDIDYWTQVNKNSGFTLFMTITTLDERVTSFFEPGASSVEQRIHTLKLFHDAGCAVGALVMPLLPGISDGSPEVRELYTRLKEAGVCCIIPGWLTLRPGRQKDYFLNSLETWRVPGEMRLEKPELPGLYKELYAKELLSGNPGYDYRKKLEGQFFQYCRELGVAPFLPHGVYRKIFHKADEIFMVMNQMADWYSRLGYDTARLGNSLKSYGTWLVNKKKELGTIRGGGGELQVGALLERALVTREFETVINNKKLSGFLREILDGRLFEPWIQENRSKISSGVRLFNKDS